MIHVMNTSGFANYSIECTGFTTDMPWIQFELNQKMADGMFSGYCLTCLKNGVEVYNGKDGFVGCGFIK